MSDALKPLIDAAANGPLTRAQAETAFEILFDGDATPGQIGGFLMALRTRGETVDEYAAAAKVMRAKCLPVKAPADAMDIVGTGGDGKHTLNISTATAFVVAGAGVTVAKHGNRNLSSKSGTADVQGQMGINVMVVALKRGPVGQHRKAGRAAVCVSFGQNSWVKIGANKAFGGAGFFNLGNQPVSRMRGLQEPVRKTACRRGVARAGLNVCHGGGQFARGHVLEFIGFDFVENVHGCPCVMFASVVSALRAAPLSMLCDAISTPCGRVLTRFATSRAAAAFNSTASR